MTRKYRPEKRHHPRLIFNEPDKIAVLLSMTDAPDHMLSAGILNMSEGGLQISLRRSSSAGIKQGGAVLLKQFRGLEELALLADLSMQVIWVIDNEHLEHLLIGLAFEPLSEPQQQTLRSFIKNCFALTQEKKEADKQEEPLEKQGAASPIAAAKP